MAQLLTIDQRGAPHVAVLRSWLRDLEALGYRGVRTGAVSTLRLAPYEALGFREVQRLTLLHADLTKHSERLVIGAGLRRTRPDELGVLSALDHRAFPPGWGLDEVGIAEAAGATPRHRIRVAPHDERGEIPLGYSITGRAGRLAFLQRLAVDPEAQTRGIGGALVADSLRWARRWRCHSMAVNTQDDNERALSLYKRAGFVAKTHGLVVLERALGSS